MSNVPGDLRYAKSHEWLKLAGDGTATVEGGTSASADERDNVRPLRRDASA